MATMSVQELIAALDHCPQDAEVYLWVNGQRHAVSHIDDSIGGAFVDINSALIVHCLKCDHTWQEETPQECCPRCGNPDSADTVYMEAL